MSDERKKAIVETLKLGLRLGILIGLPLVVDWATHLHGTWGVVVGRVLPVVLPLVDKFVHEDPRVPASGVLPF